MELTGDRTQLKGRPQLLISGVVQLMAERTSLQVAEKLATLRLLADQVGRPSWVHKARCLRVPIFHVALNSDSPQIKSRLRNSSLLFPSLCKTIRGVRLLLVVSQYFPPLIIIIRLLVILDTQL